MSATIRFTISDFPPSVNNLFNTIGHRRVETPRYKAWKKSCRDEMMMQRVRPVAGPVNIRVDLVAPDNRRRDADNCSKAVIDALVNAGVIEGDDQRFMRRLSIGWELEGAPCTVTVTSCETLGEAAVRLTARMDRRAVA